MKLLPVALFSMTFLLSCKPSTKDDSAVTGTTATDTLSTPDTHTSANSLDWAGTYRGTIPCADCEGIETMLTLNNSQTYKLVTRYLGKGDGQYIQKEGVFTWNQDGKTIMLKGIENAPSQYSVGENMIIQLDMSGQPIFGDMASKYFLMKQ